MDETIYWDEFRALVSDLLSTETVQKMREHSHHVDFTCYEHSVFVAYITYRIARKMRLDVPKATRAALLHDLYLYDPDLFSHYRQCFLHPLVACENAKRLCPDLTEKEENAIRAHMFPFSKELPHSREAIAVSVADKFCATIETLRIFGRLRIRNKVLSI